MNGVVNVEDWSVLSRAHMEIGQFGETGTGYAISKYSVNIPTKFFLPYTPEDAQAPGTDSSRAAVSFVMTARSTFSVILSAKSSVSGQADRGYCFAMKGPGLPICPSPEPPPSPPPPSPSPPPVSPVPSPPPPSSPPPPPPTPHPPPAPLEPGYMWGAYLIELNFTYPGTKSVITPPRASRRRSA